MMFQHVLNVHLRLQEKYLKVQSLLPLTPKLHAMFYLIGKFIDGDSSTLGIFSEQATEVIHSIFKNLRQCYLWALHSDYGTQLFHWTFLYCVLGNAEIFTNFSKC